MNNEFDRYEIERVMKLYSSDLLGAFTFNRPESEKINAIARAQSVLSDIEYIKIRAGKLNQQVKECQKNLNDNVLLS